MSQTPLTNKETSIQNGPKTRFTMNLSGFLTNSINTTSIELSDILDVNHRSLIRDLSTFLDNRYIWSGGFLHIGSGGYILPESVLTLYQKTLSEEKQASIQAYLETMHDFHKDGTNGVLETHYHAQVAMIESLQNFYDNLNLSSDGE